MNQRWMSRKGAHLQYHPFLVRTVPTAGGFDATTDEDPGPMDGKTFADGSCEFHSKLSG
jgi:hypothetical protein